MSRITFTTLGPPGTNHEFVTRKYLGFHGLTATADLQLSASVDEAIERIRAGTADYFVLCSVHPDTPRAVGRHYRDMFVVDSFISPSLPLAVLTLADIEQPTSIGVLHPSTTDYIDASKWDRVVHITTGTLHTVAEGLLAGMYDRARLPELCRSLSRSVACGAGPGLAGRRLACARPRAHVLRAGSGLA